jgi:hypothetical protein
MDKSHQFHALAYLTLITIGYDSGRAPEPWRTEKSKPLKGNKHLSSGQSHCNLSSGSTPANTFANLCLNYKEIPAFKTSGNWLDERAIEVRSPEEARGFFL